MTVFGMVLGIYVAGKACEAIVNKAWDACHMDEAIDKIAKIQEERLKKKGWVKKEKK